MTTTVIETVMGFLARWTGIIMFWSLYALLLPILWPIQVMAGKENFGECLLGGVLLIIQLAAVETYAPKAFLAMLVAMPLSALLFYFFKTKIAKGLNMAEEFYRHTDQ